MALARVETEFPAASPQFEVVRGNGDKLAEQVHASIERVLCSYEQYAPDSVVYQTVAAEIDYLCEGENMTKPELIVVHDKADAITAFSTPGYMVLGSNIVRRLKKEELDALLTHELTHDKREHTRQRLTKTSQFDQTGRKRIGEFEADMFPVDWLDRKNINVWGIVSLFNKLEAMQEAQKAAAAAEARSIPPRLQPRHKPFRVDDHEHGNIVDRRVNTEEAWKIADVRNLSPGKLTDLELTEADFEAYQRDKDLLVQYDALPIVDKRRLIIRQLKSSAVTAISSRDQTLALANMLVSEVAPGLSDEDRAVAVEILNQTHTPARRRFWSNQEESPTEQLIPPDQLTTRLLTVLQHPQIKQHYILPRDFDTADSVAGMLEAGIKSHNQLPDSRAYAQLVNWFDLKNNFEADILWTPAVNFIKQNPTSQSALDYTARIAERIGTPASIVVPAEALIDPYFKVLPELERLRQSVENQRMRLVNDLFDPVEVLHLAARCGSDIPPTDPYKERDVMEQRGAELEYQSYGFKELDNSRHRRRDWSVRDENVFVQRLQEELSTLSAPELLDMIGRHRHSGVLQDTEGRQFAQVLWTELSRFPRSGDLVSNATFKDRLTLAGLLADRPQMLRFIEREFQRDFKEVDLYAQNPEVIGKLIVQHLQTIFAAHTTVDRLGFETDWEITPLDLAEAPRLQATVFEWITTLVQQNQISLAYKIASQVPLPTLEHVASDQESNEEFTALERWEQAVASLLERRKELGPNELGLLACLTRVAPDLSTRLNLPPRLIRDITRQLSFERAVDFLADGLPALPRHLFLEALDELVEERDLTSAEWALLTEKLGNRLLEYVDDASGTLGKLSLADAILLPNYGQMPLQERVVGIKRDEVRGLEAKRLLITMLSTARSDEDLSQYMLERWWMIMRTARKDALRFVTEPAHEEDDPYRDPDELSEAFRVEDILWLKGDNKKLKREYWVSSIPTHLPNYKSLQEVVDSALTASMGMKYYYLRKLLLDESYGVLHSAEDRNELIDQFIANWLDNPDDEAARFVRDSLRSLTDVTDPEVLYQHIYPLLMDIVLLPPEQRTETKVMAYQFADKLFDDLYARGQFGPMPRDSREATDALFALREKVHGLLSGSSQLTHDLEYEAQRIVLHEFAANIRELVARPDRQQEIILKSQIEARIYAIIAHKRTSISAQLSAKEQASSISDILKARFTPELTHMPEGQRLSALDLLFKLGERSGALGTRMLQLGGMYFDMPEEQREKFAHVYDNMKGQSRLQAWQTLQREAQYSPAIAEMLDNLATLKPRIGGGSLMTVYEAVMKDGSREAIAVKNPNAEYHLYKMVTVIDKMLEDLEAKRADEGRIKLVRSLLEDVVQWIHDELTDPDFEVKDEQFRLWHSFREQNPHYRPGKNRYKLLVPRSLPTQSRWIRRDEMIDGANINKLVLVSSLKVDDEPTNIQERKISHDDYRAVTSLLVHSFVHQLTEHGIIHSDIHPGNFTITNDNQSLAVFDRYNLLLCDESERQLFRRVLRTVATGNTVSGMNEMVNHILALPENQHADQSHVKQMIEQSAQTSADLAETGPKALLALKQSGVRVPIKYTLIMKNVLSLQRLSKKAGFNGIADAYLATAEPTEVMKLISG